MRDQLVNWWGNDVLDAQGRVDREAISQIVFSDPEQLRRLESVTHPEVGRQRAALHEHHEANPQVLAIIEDSPLLLEKGLAKACDVLVWVETPRVVRLQRLQNGRGWSEAELDRREKNQWPLDNKRKQADYVVNNHAGADETFDQTRRVLSLILQKYQNQNNARDVRDV